MLTVDKSLSQQTKSTLKWITAGVFVFGVIYMSKKIYQKFTAKQQPAQKPSIKQSSSNSLSQQASPQRLHTKHTEYSQFYFDKVQQIQQIQSSLSEFPTVQQIYLSSPLIAQEQFIKYTRQIRKRRRLIRKSNEEQYINIILMYEAEIKELLIRSRIQLLQSIGLNVDEFENMEQNYEAIEDLRALQRKTQQVLRNKLKTQTKRKPMSNQKLQLIIQQQMHFIRNKMYDRLKNKLQKEVTTNEHEILLVVETLMEDIIYEKFGYEHEDIARKIQEVSYNTGQLDQVRNSLKMEIGGFHFESQQSEPDDDQAFHLNESMKTTGKTSQENENDR